jgi:ring-1,2-phenylacetyl-CoA epoxidase subunit PaaD
VNQQQAWNLLGQVPDPEIPVLSVVDLGIVRDLEVGETGGVSVTLTPTYSGCPATQPIREAVHAALAEHFASVEIHLSLAPAWTTDWITHNGRRRLEEFGIAPPNPRSDVNRPRACPQCGATDTERISEFGSTPCKALYRCRACREPFDYFKCL